MLEYTIQTGNIIKKITESSIDNALRRFFYNIKAKDFGILVSIDYEKNKQKETKLAPVEGSLMRLGMYGKFEKEIKKIRDNNKSSAKDVVDYE